MKEYGLQNVTLENLRSAIQKQGYTIVEYNNIFNGENVAALIDALGLENFCEGSKGFTYADKKRRLVFLHEDLSDKEKMMILAHEEVLANLKKNIKDYPRGLLQLKAHLEAELERQVGRPVRIDILADVLELTDEQWRGAVEAVLID